jgi:hypothetical protein
MPDCDCGCCAGTSVQTPRAVANRPGLAAIAYRAGTWATFKESMLARLSSSDYPALSRLRTRDDDDFSIAFLDATAVVLDILTFYQERLAHESYLGTAVQLRSLVELARLIGYQPAPGVSASTYLAFTLKSAPGQPPDPSAPAITMPKGTQVQSVPAQGQLPQTFETSAPIAAKADWNALPVQTGQPWVPPGSSGLYLSGTATQLQPGDSLLILGIERETWSPDPNGAPGQWDVVVLKTVRTDSVRNLTYVAWDQRLYHVEDYGAPAPQWTTAKVFAFRQKAGLFGSNAPNPNLFVDPNHNTSTNLPGLINDKVTPWEWKNYNLGSYEQVDLDAVYQKIVVRGWFALREFGFAQLYKVARVGAVSRADFGLSGRVTELSADDPSPDIRLFGLQYAEVWAQSEQLTIAEQPLDHALYGTYLDLKDLRPDLASTPAVALSGRRQKLAVADGSVLQFKPIDDPANPLTLNPGDVVTLIDPSPLPMGASGEALDWYNHDAGSPLSVEDASGRPGTVAASLSKFVLAPSGSQDPVVSEYALVSSVVAVDSPYPHTQLLLRLALTYCYDRATTTVNANVGLATHGQTVTELLGSGSAATPNQRFTLRQSPLTFVQALTPTGRQSTLQVRANSVSWTEVPSLYQHGPSDQVFATLNQADNTTAVLFGDGVEGATLPTGQNNIQATYRIGSGAAGNVAAGSITTLIDRPLGVSGVAQPADATGGQDPQSVDDIRAAAPQQVLTLGRAVSITDYQNYARTFAGIAKAHAIWIPSGPGRGVFLTVAGVGGAALPPGNPTLANLVASLHDYGNPLIPIIARSFLETLFGFAADLRYDPAYDPPTVKARVLETLSSAYSFARRDFGQGVSADEVSSLIQGVPGVVGVNVTQPYTTGTSAAGDLAGAGGTISPAKLNDWQTQNVKLQRPYSDSPTRICPYVPLASPDSVPHPAEILVLDPNPGSVVLGTMT